MRIAIFAFDGVSMFHLASPLMVFNEVSRLGLAQGWDAKIWTIGKKYVHTAEGIQLGNVTGPNHAELADIVVLPSWFSELPEPDEPLLKLVQTVHHRGGVIAGLCLGAFPIAATGLLDGRAATTHWLHTETLAARYPSVHVLPDSLYIDHGDVLTSAGTASALDACLHIVRQRLGNEAATTIARRAVLAPYREGGQAQYIDRPIPAHDTDSFGKTLQWIQENLAEPLTVETMASHTHMSVRNFTRRFVDSVGVTPARWVLTIRLNEARRLLEVTDWSVEKIARACGFTNAVTFRQNFVKHYSTSPTSYRKRFTKQPR